jgi:hypothetical protein
MNNDFNSLLELIDSVKACSEYGEVKFIGSKEYFDKLAELGFYLENVRYQEFSFDESNIFILPVNPKPVKIYCESDELDRYREYVNSLE